MTTYADAGVDIDRGDEIVRRIAAKVPGIGDFGGRFPLELAGMKRPVLVAGADGVGTKIKLAIDAEKHDTIGIDLVAMNVNDILCSGARPLFFLDYVAAARLDPDTIEKVVSGMIEGCRQAGCRLLGGETAELPGFYSNGDYELAGFAVGIVDDEKSLGAARVRAGDVLLGLASSGVHSNGYSLARKALDSVLNEPFAAHTVRDELLTPTRIYVEPVMKLSGVHAIAHITGGGIPGNVERVIPDGCGVEIDSSSWEIPAIFRLIQTRGRVPEDEMRRTFNLGIGMILVLPKEEVAAAQKSLAGDGVASHVIGRVIGEEGIRWR